mmetsp:Transcript_18863/g.37041  ORF Transcript_18863/g.37041 Transcript_18863/m.37041 type:complete len:235 (+) Transcript_18863:606-1310(+)
MVALQERKLVHESHPHSFIFNLLLRIEVLCLTNLHCRCLTCLKTVDCLLSRSGLQLHDRSLLDPVANICELTHLESNGLRHIPLQFISQIVLIISSLKCGRLSHNAGIFADSISWSSTQLATALLEHADALVKDCSSLDDALKRLVQLLHKIHKFAEFLVARESFGALLNILAVDTYILQLFLHALYSALFEQLQTRPREKRSHCAAPAELASSRYARRDNGWEHSDKDADASA